MEFVTVDALFERYDAFLVDAYGVLVSNMGALPGAADFVERLRRERKAFLVVSNDASRLPTTTAARYSGFGIALREEEILTSGMLLARHFAERGLVGRRTLVLGPEDSRRYVELAGGIPTESLGDDAAEVVVVADDDGYPFLAGVEEAMSAIMRRIERGAPIHLVLPNPDLIYPKGFGDFGLTSGSVALLIEAGLRVRYGDSAPTFEPLGKPHAPMFDAAFERIGPLAKERTVILGDQLSTDIRGGRDYGIAAVLLGSGLTHLTGLTHLNDLMPESAPTAYLPSLA